MYSRLVCLLALIVFLQLELEDQDQIDCALEQVGGRF